MFVLLLTVFIDLVGFGIILPILPFYAQAFDATPLQITLLVAVYSAVQIASSPIWGRLSDRYGRKIILLLTLTGGAMAYLWFGLVESLAGLFAARALSGAMAGNIAVAQAYMADISDTDDLAGAMSRLGGAFGLGFVAGPALGGLLIGVQPGVADFCCPAWSPPVFPLPQQGLAWPCSASRPGIRRGNRARPILGKFGLPSTATVSQASSV
jgi:DHA1 family tetracycline resistance protein-like MFS transporter